jgi:hypothetical protein
MAWNRTGSILGSGASAEYEADVIFTAAFVGLAADFARKNKQWRVAMEPEMTLKSVLGDQRPARTADDRKAMEKHNQLCTRVNQAVRNYLNVDNAKPLTWGFTPSFAAGGMIAGGPAASQLDLTLNAAFKQFARKYLTNAKTPTNRTDVGDMYIGRGAYCGLVLDEQGDAVSAMSTVRTTIKENSQLYPAPLNGQVGDRWCPPSTNPKYGEDSTSVQTAPVNKSWIWGMIGDKAAMQQDLQNQGMKFYMGNDNRKGTDLVGYTHGLPRAVYECVRAHKGHPYEMSIGTQTFKLASCMGCTFFMIANGFEPSASHVGRSESWAPLYHVQGNNPSPVLAPIDKDHDQIAAFELANNRWADAVAGWMKEGIAAMDLLIGDGWITDNHKPALAALKTKVADTNQATPAKRRICCNLLLDAFTWHKSDADRVNDTMKIGAHPKPGCDGTKLWWDTDTTTRPETFLNPYTDDQLKKLGDLNELSL